MGSHKPGLRQISFRRASKRQARCLMHAAQHTHGSKTLTHVHTPATHRPRSVGTVFFSALSFSLAVVLAHGAFREPDNLFIDDAEVCVCVLGGWLGGWLAAVIGV